MLQRYFTGLVAALLVSSTASAAVIDIDFNPGSGQNVDIFGNDQGVLYFTGTDGFQVYFTDDDSNGSYGGDADGVHITNLNFGNIHVGSQENYVLGAYNDFYSGSNQSYIGSNYHSSGIRAVFNQGATLVRFDDTDNDSTTKSLFAYDAAGNLIGQSAPASQVPVVVDTSMTGGQLIYSVEFDTAAGTAGGSFDGTYFTIDNFHVEGVSPDTQIDIGFPTVPVPGTVLLLGLGLLGLGSSRRLLQR